MRIPRRFSQALDAAAERVPILGRLQGSTRESILLGGLVGAVVFFFLGGIFGALNRAVVGAIVGSLCGACFGIFAGVAISLGMDMVAPLVQRGQAVTLTLHLDNEEARYLPGDMLTGQLLVSADRAVRLHGGSVYLVCRGFQAYDKALENGSREPHFVHAAKEHQVLQADVVPSATVRRGGTLSFPFEFELPLRSLPTHKGYVYSVLWTLHAVARLPDGAEAKARQEILVEAIPPAGRGVDGEHQTIAPTQVCQMVLTLPSVLIGEGERLSAQVRITPITSLALTEVRAVLLRVENIAAGDDHTVYVAEWDAKTGMFRAQRQPGGVGTTFVWLEAETVLSGPVQLAAAESVIHRFVLDVPSEWRPSVAGPDGRVTWKVGVIASRPDKADLRAFHEVIVHTASAHPRAVLTRSMRH